MRAAVGLAGMTIAGGRSLSQDEPASALALVRNTDRRDSLNKAFRLLGRMDFGGRDLFIKANYNSADPFPASTHPEMLTAVVELLRSSHCGRITLVERSGMGATQEIWEKLGIPGLAGEIGIELLALDALPASAWRKELLPGTNWKSGVEVPYFLDGSAFLIQICNLKTHRFGGVFSGSLKNSVGLIAKYGHVAPGYNYMKELHGSPQQGSMIAELNLIYAPKLILMDATEVFTSGGPEAGESANPEVVFASADRLAIDAAGVALLRLYGAKDAVSWRTVYELDQLKRASELKLGATSAAGIRFLTAEAHGSILASQLEAILQEPPKTK